MDQRLALLANRARQTAMRVPERGDADAGEQIDVLPAFGIPQTNALAADERHRLPPVGLQHMARLAPHHLVQYHCHHHTTI